MATAMSAIAVSASGAQILRDSASEAKNADLTTSKPSGLSVSTNEVRRDIQGQRVLMRQHCFRNSLQQRDITVDSHLQKQISELGS